MEGVMKGGIIAVKMTQKVAVGKENFKENVSLVLPKGQADEVFGNVITRKNSLEDLKDVLNFGRTFGPIFVPMEDVFVIAAENVTGGACEV